MNRVRGLLAAALLLPALAGCTDSGSPAPEAAADTQGLLTARELQVPGYYAFGHPGGDITFRLGEGEQATIGLFDARDRPVATLGWRAASVTVPSVEPGELVLRVLAVNGSLAIDLEGGGRPWFLPLGRTVERHVLANRPAYNGPIPLGIPLLEQYEPIDESVPFNFTRPPDAMRVLATGNLAGLEVEVLSGKGSILTAGYQGGAGPGQPYFSSSASFYEVPSMAHLENLGGLEAEARVKAEHLDGALILETETYSRARPPRADGQAWAQEAPAFVYSGAVEPFVPVRFQLADQARSIQFVQDNATAGDGVVALFDPHDVRLATVEVPPNRSVRLDVSVPGEYVAVLLAGSVAIGADAAPADFELHPVGTDEAVVPEGPPATQQPNDYSQERLPVDTDFTPFRVVGLLAEPTGGELLGGQPTDPFTACDPGSLRLLAGGEPIGFWDGDQEGADPGMDAGATRLLSGGLEMERDGFGGDACPYQAVRLVGYDRSIAAE